MKSPLTTILSVVIVAALLVGGFLAFRSDGSEERREDRQTERQAGQAGQCAPATEQEAQDATRAFLDRFLGEDGQGALKGVGPVQQGGGWILFVSTGNENPLAKEPDCFRGVPVRYQRTPPDIP